MEAAFQNEKLSKHIWLWVIDIETYIIRLQILVMATNQFSSLHHTWTSEQIPEYFQENFHMWTR